MLVSGGKILAIDKVNTGNTILGDGVQEPLVVNTDLIATTSSVSSVSSVLEQQIDSVSSNFQNYYKKTETSGADEISAAFENFKTNQTIVSAGSPNVTVDAIPSGDKTLIYCVKVAEGDVSIVGTSGISATLTQDGVWKLGLSANYLSANALNNYYNKTQVDNKLAATSSWANGKFQEKGDYVSAYDFDQFKTDVNAALDKKQDVSAMTAYAQSAWVDDNYQKKGNYVSADDFNEYKTQVSQEFTNTSAWANETFQEKGEYVSASDFEDYKEKVEQDFENTSAWANETFQPIGEYISASEKFLSANALDDISGKWESVYDTVNSNSANWNEASAFAANSAKFVTSAGVDFNPDLAYFLKKQEESVVWSGIDLTNLGKMYQISSLTPDLISAGISADEQNNQFYVLSAAKPGEVAAPGISGENGVSAHYNDEENTYVIGLSGSPAYASYTASVTADNGTYTPDEYSEAYNVGTGIVLEDGELSVAPGLWHVTIYAKITNVNTSTDYYDTTLKCKTVNKKNIVQFDNSYIHTEYINLDTDINNATSDNLQIEIELTDVPANSVVELEQLQIHKIVTGNVNSEGGATYIPGDAISIDNYHINVQAGSGIYVDPNNKLSIKLGKGLAFSADGDVVAIETNTEVNDVVETVENLKQELDGKLTTNMNISDAKTRGNPWNGAGDENNFAAAFFTVPLQHNLTSASEISFFTTQNIVQSNAYPLIVGILEYNFDYIVPDTTAYNGVRARSQTQWIADTGPIWADTQDVAGHYLSATSGRFTYKLKNVTPGSANDVPGDDGTIYHNEFGPTLRSDRAYYLAFYAYHSSPYMLMCDDGYESSINNTDPEISFRHNNVQYITDGYSATINDALLTSAKDNNISLTLSAMPYWDRQINAANLIQRPYIMIRNPRL